MLLETVRKQIIETALELTTHNLVVIDGGNVSVRDKASGIIAITPSGIPYNTMTIDDIVIVDIEGKVVEGSLKPSVDLQTHLAIYKSRPDIYSVIHTHSTYASILGVLGLRLPDVTSPLAYSNGAGGVEIIPYTHVFDPKHGDLVVEKLGSGHAVIIENHGVFTCGESIKKCLQVSLIVEQASQIYVVAKSIGEPRILSTKHAQEIGEHYLTKHGQNTR